MVRLYGRLLWRDLTYIDVLETETLNASPHNNKTVESELISSETIKPAIFPIVDRKYKPPFLEFIKVSVTVDRVPI